MIFWQEWWRWQKVSKMKAWGGGKEKVIFGDTNHGCKNILSLTQLSCSSSDSDSRTTVSCQEIKELQRNPVLQKIGTSALLRVVKKGRSCEWYPRGLRGAVGNEREDLGPKHVMVVVISSAKLGLNERLLAWNILYITIFYILCLYSKFFCP